MVIAFLMGMLFGVLVSVISLHEYFEHKNWKEFLSKNFPDKNPYSIPDYETLKKVYERK